MKVRVSEEEGVSPRIGKSVKGTLLISLSNHMVICDHQVTGRDFTIGEIVSNKYTLELKENLFVKRDG